MKRFFSIIISFTILGFFYSCDSDNDRNDENTFFRGQPGANFSLNLDLVTNSRLKFPGETVFLPNNIALGSIEGVYIFTADAINYIVFELAEPNHPIGSCSTPTKTTNGRIEYTCGEEKTSYDLFGNKVDGKQGFPLRGYNAVRSGNVLRVSF